MAVFTSIHESRIIPKIFSNIGRSRKKEIQSEACTSKKKKTLRHIRKKTTIRRFKLRNLGLLKRLKRSKGFKNEFSMHQQENTKFTSPLKNSNFDLLDEVEANNDMTSPVKLKRQQSIVADHNESFDSTDSSITSTEGSRLIHGDTPVCSPFANFIDEINYSNISGSRIILFNESDISTLDNQAMDRNFGSYDRLVHQEVSIREDATPLTTDTDILVSPCSSHHSSTGLIMPSKIVSDTLSGSNGKLSEISFDSDLDYSKFSIESHSTPTKIHLLKQLERENIYPTQSPIETSSASPIFLTSLASPAASVSPVLNTLEYSKQGETLKIESSSLFQNENGLSSEIYHEEVEVHSDDIAQLQFAVDQEFVHSNYLSSQNNHNEDLATNRRYEIVAETSQYRSREYKSSLYKKCKKNNSQSRKRRKNVVFERLLDVNKYTGMYKQRFVSNSQACSSLTTPKGPLTAYEKKFLKHLTANPKLNIEKDPIPVSNSHNPYPVLKLRM